MLKKKHTFLWWSFLYFMGEGGERETGENQRSTKVRGKVREVNKPPPTWKPRGRR